MTDTKESATAQTANYERFIERAEVAAAKVSVISSFEEAASYAIDLCLQRPLNRYAISDEPVVTDGVRKVIAAPSLSSAEYDLLCQKAADHDIECISSGLRSHLHGVDVGLSYGDLGLAETGTLVLNCPDEELRLATMVCEYHVCVLPKSNIYADGYEAEEQLRTFMLDAPNYTAFITGPSRTADIERVLSIGVHGPLELHILIVED